MRAAIVIKISLIAIKKTLMVSFLFSISLKLNKKCNSLMHYYLQKCNTKVKGI